MPTYDYHCDKCGKNFSLLLTIREHEQGKVVCPKCQSNRVSQRVTGFTAITSKKS